MLSSACFPFVPCVFGFVLFVCLSLCIRVVLFCTGMCGLLGTSVVMSIASSLFVKTPKRFSSLNSLMLRPRLERNRKKVKQQKEDKMREHAFTDGCGCGPRLRRISCTVFRLKRIKLLCFGLTHALDGLFVCSSETSLWDKHKSKNPEHLADRLRQKPFFFVFAHESIIH